MTEKNDDCACCKDGVFPFCACSCHRTDNNGCRHEWGNYTEWNDTSGLHGSKRCILCGRYVQW
jgi:hypothetical protein